MSASRASREPRFHLDQLHYRDENRQSEPDVGKAGCGALRPPFLTSTINLVGLVAITTSANWTIVAISSEVIWLATRLGMDFTDVLRHLKWDEPVANIEGRVSMVLTCCW